MLCQLLLYRHWACSCCSWWPLNLSRSTAGRESQGTEACGSKYKRSDTNDRGIAAARVSFEYIAMGSVNLLSDELVPRLLEVMLTRRRVEVRDKSCKEGHDSNTRRTAPQPNAELWRCNNVSDGQVSRRLSKHGSLINESASRMSFIREGQRSRRTVTKPSVMDGGRLVYISLCCSHLCVCRSKVLSWLGRWCTRVCKLLVITGGCDVIVRRCSRGSPLTISWISSLLSFFKLATPPLLWSVEKKWKNQTCDIINNKGMRDPGLVVYTRGGCSCSCSCGLLSLVLFPWKRHVLTTPTTTPYSVWLTTLRMVVHAHVASLQSFKAKVQEESWRGNHFNTTIFNSSRAQDLNQ
jgi:hypothetical protein